MRHLTKHILRHAIFAVLVCMRGSAWAQQSIPLWPEGQVPLSQGTDSVDIPLLIHIEPSTVAPTTRAAAIVCPGGSYEGVAADHEGFQITDWFAAQGITCFICMYRIAPYRHPVPFLDASRAVRLVRARAEDFAIDTNRILLLGFSAGGHLASTVATRFDSGNPASADSIERVSNRPDYLALVYPVISLDEAVTHPGSRDNLLGENPPADSIIALSNEKNVSAQTPPTYLAHSDTDPDVPIANSELFRDSCIAKGVPVTLHIDHGLYHGYAIHGTWEDTIMNWFDSLGWLPEGASIEPRRALHYPGNASLGALRPSLLPLLHPWQSWGARGVRIRSNGSVVHDCAGRMINRRKFD